MAMEEGLDTGPVLLERSIQIGLLENAHQLAERLAALTGTLLVEALPLIEAAGPGAEAERLGRLGVRAQGEEGMTYARMLTKEDAQIDWDQSALHIHRKVMGLYPGATSSWQGKRLKLLATEPLVKRLAAELSPEAAELAERWGLRHDGQPSSDAAKPGTVLAVMSGVGMVVASSGCPLLVREAQLEGKAAASGTQLLQQLQAKAGDQLGYAAA
jgi:methionyl-tRNA formyltransferase